MENYLDSLDLGYLAKKFVKLPASEETETWLYELGESATVKKVQGSVKLATARYIENLMQTIDESDEEDLDDYLTKKAEEDLETKLEELLNECVEDYSNIRSVSGPAKTMLGMMNLKIGKVAPDIIGLDLDDVEFKLSDYGGKVVVVDFWGDW